MCIYNLCHKHGLSTSSGLFDVLQPHQLGVLDTAALLPTFGAAIACITALTIAFRADLAAK